MPVTLIQLRTREKVDYGVTAGTSTLNRSYRTLLRRNINELHASLAGAAGDGDFVFKYDPAEAAHANAGLAISSGSGAVGATLNGVATTATWATSDVVAAGLVAYAIASSTTARVKGMFLSSNLHASITLASVLAGQYVDICGTRITATNGTPAQIHSGQNAYSFDMSGNDAADATALAATINSAPELSRYVFAIPVSNVVRLFARQATWSATTSTWSWPARSRQPTNVITASAATFTLSGNALAASAYVGIQSVDGGAVGNAHTIAASGTGVTVLNSETRLDRGAALDLGAIIGEG